VIVDNETAGQTLVDASTQVIPVPMDSVTSSNVAIAINANCVGCHSSAVAVQILIVRGSPSNFAPGNAAAAANGGCDSCGAYAYARQHWIQTSSNAHLSGAVRQQIGEIRQEISTTAASILPSDAATDPDLSRDDELDARLDALTAQLIHVVTAGLEEYGADTTVLQDNVEVDGTTPSS
jgi:Fe-S cluster biogenesis protein NfuA